MVKDGTYLIGTSAVVTKFDLPMLFQSHLYRIRVGEPGIIDPWLLFALLNTRVVELQVPREAVHAGHHRHHREAGLRGW